MNVTSTWYIEGSSLLVDKPKLYVDVVPGDIIQLIDDTTCFSLNKPSRENVLECKLKLSGDLPKKNSPEIQMSQNIKQKIQSGAKINQIVIVSEAKLVEVYTTMYEEYCQTVQSELISSFDDSVMYKTSFKFNSSQNFVTLSLKGLFLEDSVWVYGLFIGVDTTETLKSLPSDLSQYVASPSSKYMLQMLTNSSTKEGKWQKLLENKLSSLLNEADQEHHNSISREKQCECNDLKQSIIYKFDDLENKLTNHIDSKFMELNANVDKRLQQIEKSLQELQFVPNKELT